MENRQEAIDTKSKFPWLGYLKFNVSKNFRDAGSSISKFIAIPLSRESSTTQPYLIDVMSASQKKQFIFLVTVWALAFISFWFWWIDEGHIIGLQRYIINTLSIGWTILMPGYFFFFLARMKKPNPALSLPDNLRVAMVVTKAPSEPFLLVMKTLCAMLEQNYPHDTWLADEDPSGKVIKWCEDHNVKISTRKGVKEYHQPCWPRRTKCKEGNLAYFYDHYGYDNYDIVVQLDADHKPAAGYLEEMIRPFLDPAVGYVSAPSMCIANLDKSWTARARVYAEANVHGPIQAGYSNGFAPLCIGSHYAIRTSALKEIGGIGPELAEDHSTTYLMNGHGWRGVHAFDAMAEGDGPLSFADFAAQEFQWSKSVTNILLSLTPQFFGRLKAELKFQFLFAQFWYTFLGATMLFSFLIPPIALITKTPWVNVVYLEFFSYSSILMGTVIMMVFWLRKNGWQRPVNAKIFSWELMMFIQ